MKKEKEGSVPEGKNIIGYGVYEGIYLVTYDHNKGLGWKFPAIFSSMFKAEMFVTQQKDRGKFEVRKIVIRKM